MVAILGLVATFLLTAATVTAQIPASISSSCATGGCKSLLSTFGNTASAVACASDITCLCTDAVASSVKSCYQCITNAKLIDQTTANTAVSNYLADCKQAGHPVNGASSLKMSGFAAAAALSGLILL